MEDQAVPIGCDLHQLAERLQVLAGAAEDGSIGEFVSGVKRVADEVQPPGSLIALSVQDFILRDFVARSLEILPAPRGNFCAGVDVRTAFKRWADALTAEGLPFGGCRGNLSPQIRRVMAILLHDYGRPLRLRDVAGSVGWSESYLCEMFKRGAGITVHECLTRIRIARAVALLRDGTKPEAAALLVGYPHRSRFYQAFRKAAGCTPGQFLRAIRSEVS